MASGTDYDAQLRDVSTRGRQSTDDAYWDLVTTDIGHATDILRPHYDEWDGHDGFVSLEVSPDLAHVTRTRRSPRPRSCGRASTGPTS